MGDVASGIFGAIGAGKASSAEEGAAQDAANAEIQSTQIAAQSEISMYQQGRSDLLPWMSGGAEGLAEQEYLLGMPSTVPYYGEKGVYGLNNSSYGGAGAAGYGVNVGQKQVMTPAGWNPSGTYGAYSQPFTQEQMFQDPGYQFALQTSLDSIQAQSAAQGTYGSGQTGTALENMGYNLASQEYGNAYSRWQDIYNRFGALSAQGQGQSQVAAGLAGQTGSTLAGIYENQGNSLANIYSGLGAQLGSNAMAGYKSLGGVAGGVGQGLGNLYGGYQQQNLLNSIYGSGYGAGGLYGGGGSPIDMGSYAAEMGYGGLY